MRAGVVRHPLLFIALFAIAGPPLGGCLAAIAFTAFFHGGAGALQAITLPAFYGLSSVFGFILGFPSALATAGVALLVQRRSRRVTAFEIIALGTIASALLVVLFGLSWPGAVVTVAGGVATAILWGIAFTVRIVTRVSGPTSPPFA